MLISFKDQSLNVKVIKRFTYKFDFTKFYFPGFQMADPLIFFCDACASVGTT